MALINNFKLLHSVCTRGIMKRAIDSNALLPYKNLQVCTPLSRDVHNSILPESPMLLNKLEPYNPLITSGANYASKSGGDKPAKNKPAGLTGCGDPPKKRCLVGRPVKKIINQDRNYAEDPLCNPKECEDVVRADDNFVEKPKQKGPQAWCDCPQPPPKVRRTCLDDIEKPDCRRSYSTEASSAPKPAAPKTAESSAPSTDPCTGDNCKKSADAKPVDDCEPEDKAKDAKAKDAKAKDAKAKDAKPKDAKPKPKDAKDKDSKSKEAKGKDDKDKKGKGKEPCGAPPPGKGKMECLKKKDVDDKKKNKACLSITMPGCKPPFSKERCAVPERPIKKCRVSPPLPSFSECCREPLAKDPPTECNCYDPLSPCLPPKIIQPSPKRADKKCETPAK